ncbi:TLD domain-containing protein [Aspergillus thermomutatus]|uniref:Restriction of telomere capping protein 5 n=1 Tax=Aspergillus thermomutatus TaxID=41047 RepID=A0A397HIN4_ASPTH|nr:Restriction of telomere capping protein 5 [Aspergillus thermomutatus]RHZ62817.1 Restriction of telomere capping protein 5 [Aspergillus thermomutatus]
MGVGQSTEHMGHTGTPEHLSQVLAERFATKCFTPLELTHFKDNFFSRAIDQGGIKYWNEKILSDFLGIPDSSDSHCPLDAGPVIFRMVSYLGAFPFQNTLAPSVLTFEAMVKVAVLLTERYGKVLRRARKDRIKLLFGSLADVGRRDVGGPRGEEDVHKETDDSSAAKSRVTGFEIDAPANDDYEDEDEDDDDLALAALESLDAIDVFKHDSRIDKKVYEARISVATFRRLLMLLIVIAPLKSLESVKTYTSDLNEARMESVRTEADTILAAFSIEDSDGGIGYQSFANITSTALPYLFDPLTPLFEHLLFSKNLDLTQKSGSDATVTDTIEKPPDGPRSSPSTIMLSGSFESTILKSSVVSHLSFFLSSSTANVNLLRGNMRLHPVFSTAAHGSSLTSFSHNVLTWNAGTLLLLEGVVSESSEQGEGMITLGAYLPQPWKSAPLSHSPTKPSDSSALPCLFELSPKHQLLQGNPAPSVQKPNAPVAYFSTSTGIAIGCQIPPPSRSQHLKPMPLGAGSLTIDASLESATFYVSSIGHNGVFLPPATTRSPSEQTVKRQIDIFTLEIWGLVPEPSDASSAEPRQSAVELQRAKWEFEAREAERRRNLNLKAGAGDSAMEGARWLLETAGLIGDRPGRGGGSI